MRERDQKGEGRLGSIIWFVVIVGLGIAGWNVGPVYFNNYALSDKMNEIARIPRTRNADEKIMDALMKEVRERNLDPYIKRTDFRVSTEEFRRRIHVEYTRTVDVLPGWKKTFNFVNDVEQPLIY